MHHFILTRFNLTLWTKDKGGKKIDRESWLEKRLELFERYCLPSVARQTCKDFVWVLLMDENTPDIYRERILGYKKMCPQIRLVKVKSGYGFRFVEVFQGIVREYLEERLEGGGRLGRLEGLEGLERLERLEGGDEEYCLTTYFDNDDALEEDYVEKVQRFVKENRDMGNSYFIAYDYGYQYFAQICVTTRIKYPNNHFMTLVERICNAPLNENDNHNDKVNEKLNDDENDNDNHNEKHDRTNWRKGIGRIRTCYGYGSHFMLEAKGVAKVVHVVDKDKPMWTEVIHEGNVDNDVKMTWDTVIVSGTAMAKLKFGLRAIKQICRRTHDKIFPRNWE